MNQGRRGHLVALPALLVLQAREDGACSTEQLAALTRVSGRQVRRQLEALPGAADRLHAVCATHATPRERAQMVRRYAEVIGAEVEVRPRSVVPSQTVEVPELGIVLTVRRKAA